jgi:hypothetical protein
VPTPVTAGELDSMRRAFPWWDEKCGIARSVLASLPDYQSELYRRWNPAYFGPGESFTIGELAVMNEMPIDQARSLVMQACVAIATEWRKRKGISGQHRPAR